MERIMEGNSWKNIINHGLSFQKKEWVSIAANADAGRILLMMFSWRWFGDVIDILTENNIGYALWNFRGDFGILDSGRKDVNYTDWHGHKLDSKLLDLLKKY